MRKLRINANRLTVSLHLTPLLVLYNPYKSLTYCMLKSMLRQEICGLSTGLLQLDAMALERQISEHS